MYVPNPHTDPAFAAYMAVMLPFHSYLMLPTFVAASANLVRASLLAPVCASTAWNIAMLNLLAGGGLETDGARKPA